MHRHLRCDSQRRFEAASRILTGLVALLEFGDVDVKDAVYLADALLAELAKPVGEVAK